jgi:hypothetical protein
MRSLLLLTLAFHLSVIPVTAWRVVRGVGRVIAHPKRDVNAIANFYVNHLQRNQRGKP